MSNEFGYIPESPEQSFGNNKGIFTPTDIYDLTRAEKYTNYGQLELIETKTVSSSTSSIDFTSIKENIYNVHFLTWNGIEFSANNTYLGARLSNDGGTSYESSNYTYAVQYCSLSGANGEIKSTSASSFERFSWGDIGDVQNGYCYFYNLGDSGKFSMLTHHSPPSIESSAGNAFSYFGSQVYHSVELINAIRFFAHNTTSNFVNQGTFSLYGIKEY